MSTISSSVAKSPGGLEAELCEAFLQYRGGPCQSEEGDLPRCEEEPGAEPRQGRLHGHAVQVSFVLVSRAASQSTGTVSRPS